MSIRVHDSTVIKCKKCGQQVKSWEFKCPYCGEPVNPDKDKIKLHI